MIHNVKKPRPSSKASRAKNQIMSNTGFGPCVTIIMTEGERRTALEEAKKKKEQEELLKYSWL